MIMSSVTSLKNLGVVPTVDVQRCPSDIGSRRACEKRNCRSDLFGLAVASERSPRGHRGRKVAVAGWIHVGVDWAWLYVVDGDALRSDAARPAAGISGYRALGCAVVADAGEGRAVADNRANRDDAPAFLHARACGPSGSSDAAHIDRKEAVELGKIVGTVMHLIGREHAGIVDQNVEAPEALDYQIHQSLLGIGLVGLEGVGAYAFGQQVVDHVLGL